MSQQHFFVRGTNCTGCGVVIGEKKRVQWQRVGGTLVLLFAAYLLLDKLGILRFAPSTAEPASLLSVLAIGLVASVSSCTAVVGGLVAALASSTAKEQEALTKRERFTQHILFNTGRLFGFIILGTVIGYIGSAVQLSPRLNGVFVLAVALLMVAIGINLLELFPTPVIGMPKWLAHKVHDLAESRDPKAPLLLGAMTFFLPCGFTQSMQLYALTLGNPIQSGIVMGVFALGTMPVLLGIGGITSAVSGKTLKKITYAAGLIVLVLGFSNITNGLTLLGWNPQQAFVKPAAPSKITIVDGKQFIQMEVTEYGVYNPDVLTVTEGTPVEWSIYGARSMGCANTLVLPAFGVNEFLNPGINTVRFTPTKPGQYTFSCSMGMVRGTMIVTPR